MAALVLKTKRLEHYDGRTSPLAYFQPGTRPRLAARHGWQEVRQRIVVDHTDPGGEVKQFTASISGSASVATALRRKRTLNAAISTSGLAAATVNRTRGVTATIAGDATLAADVVRDVGLLAALDSSTVVAANLQATKALSAAINGSTIVTADITKVGATKQLIAAIDGTALVAADLNRTVGLKADITTIPMSDAAEFSGTSNFLLGTTSPFVGFPYTMVAWARTVGFAWIMQVQQSSQAGPLHSFHSGTSGDTLIARSGIGNDVVVGVTSGEWNFIAQSASGTSDRIVVINSGESTGQTSATPASNNNRISIGASVSGTTPLNGQVDHVMIYNSALSLNQMRWLRDNKPNRRELQTNPHADNPGIPDHLWQLDEASGTRADTGTAAVRIPLPESGGTVTSTTGIITAPGMTAGLNRTRGLVAAIDGTGDVLSALGVNRPLVAAIDGSGAMTATLAGVIPLSAAIAATGQVTAGLSITKRFSAAIAGSSITTADVAAIRGLSATIDATGVVASVLDRTIGLTAAIDSDALLTAVFMSDFHPDWGRFTNTFIDDFVVP